MKFLSLDGFKYAINNIVNKLKVLINEKADKTHQHSPLDIITTADRQFIDSTDKNKINTIIINGDGTKFKSDDGTYKEANSSVIITNGDGTEYLTNDGTYKLIDISATIDDKVISSTSTFSSKKINSELQLKANETDLHSHNNKNILDDITLERYTKWEEKTNMIASVGDGNSFLANDGTYKYIEGISSPIDDKNGKSTNTTYSASKINNILDDSINNLDYNITQKINTKVDAVSGKVLSSNNYTNDEKNKVALLDSSGSNNEFLAKDGYYYLINSVGINNEISGDNTTFSGSEIDKRINDGILNLVLPTQNDAPTIWKKNFENVSAGQVLEMQTSLNFSINNAIIQVYKFIAGQNNVEKTLSNFNQSDKNNYFYNEDNVEFLNSGSGHAKIKDLYVLPLSLNSDGYYESPIISKGSFVDLNKITIGGR